MATENRSTWKAHEEEVISKMNLITIDESSSVRRAKGQLAKEGVL